MPRGKKNESKKVVKSYMYIVIQYSQGTPKVLHGFLHPMFPSIIHLLKVVVTFYPPPSEKDAPLVGQNLKIISDPPRMGAKNRSISFLKFHHLHSDELTASSLLKIGLRPARQRKGCSRLQPNPFLGANLLLVSGSGACFVRPSNSPVILEPQN